MNVWVDYGQNARIVGGMPDLTNDKVFFRLLVLINVVKLPCSSAGYAVDYAKALLERVKKEGH